MKKICPHCNKEIEYDKPQQFGGHITICEFKSRQLLK